MKEYTKEDIKNAIYGELSIKERKDMVAFILKGSSVALEYSDLPEKWELLEKALYSAIKIIKTIEKEQSNVK